MFNVAFKNLMQKITVRIFDDTLYRQLKGVAKLRDTTLEAIVNEALAQKVKAILSEELRVSQQSESSNTRPSNPLALAA